MKLTILSALFMAVVAIAATGSDRVTLETDVDTLELLKSQLGSKPYRPHYKSPYLRTQRPYYHPFYRSYNQFYPYYPYYPFYEPAYVRQPYTPYVNPNEGRVTATDETLTDEEALNNLKALKDIYENADENGRLLISSISVNSDLSSITITTTSFLALLSSLTSLANITVTTATAYIPGISIG